MCPRFMTAMASAIDMASSWSCVTWTNVTPTSRWMRPSSICSCLRSLRSSAPSGSSSSSARGEFTSARERDALLLAPGELGGAPAAEPLEVHEVEDVGDALAHLGLRDALALEPE